MPEYDINWFKNSVEEYLHEICSNLEANVATLHLYDKQADRLYLPMSYGLYAQEQFERGVPDMNRVPGRIAREAASFYTEDIASSELAGPFSYTEQVVSVAGIPILDNGEVLGVLFLNYRQPHTFPASEKQRVQERVDKFTSDVIQLRKQLGLDQLTPISIPESSRQTRQEILLQRIAKTAATALEDTSIIIWLPDENHLRGQVHTKVESEFVSDLIIKKESSDPVALAHGNQTAIFIDDLLGSEAEYQLDSILEGAQKTLRWRTVQLEPIVSPFGQSLGVLSAYTRGFIGLNNDEKALLKALAASVASSIDSGQKIDSLNALHDLGTRLTLPLTLAQTLEEIVSSVPKIVGADICTIHLYGAAKQDFEDVSTAAVYGAAPEHLEKPHKKRFVTGQMWFVVEDVEEEGDDAFSPFVRAENIRAYASVNLNVVKEPVGMMFISYREPHQFTADEYTLIRAISYYAATAIYAARVLSQRDTLAKIAQEITTAHSRQDLLETVLHNSLELLGSEYGAIGLRDPVTEEIHIDYAVGTDLHVIPAGKGLIRIAIETGKPVRIDDVRQEKSYYSRRPDTVSELDVPLVRGDKVIGILNVETARPAAYTEEHEKLAVALAAQTVVALNKLDLVDQAQNLLKQAQTELKQRVADINILQGVYGALEAEELEDALSTMATRALELTGAKYSGVYLIDRSAQHPVLHLVAQPNGRVSAKKRKETIPVDANTGLIPYVARIGEAHLSDDVNQDPLFHPSEADVRSELTVPLKYGERIYGVIDLESAELNGFNDREEQLVRALAGAAAGAVRQVQLYEDLEEVNRLSEKLNSAKFENVQQVIELVHASANQLMDTNNMYIALYDDFTDTVRFGLAYVDGRRIDVENPEDWQPRSGGAGRTEWIIQHREHIFDPTKEDSLDWYNQPGRSEYVGGEEWSSWIGVPMIADDQVLGVVASYHITQEHVYSLDDLTSLIAMANQAAIAISNVRLNQQRQLREMGQLLSANIYLSEPGLLALLYEQTQELMSAEYMYIALYDQATDLVRFGFAMRPAGKVDVERNPKWKPRQAREGKGKTEWIINNRELLFHPTNHEANKWYEDNDIHPPTDYVDGSWLGVPMLTPTGTVVGVISVSHPKHDYLYDGYDLQLLETLAGVAAGAIDNAQRYREALASQELGTLGTAMGAIQHRINNTLNIVSPNVMRLRRRVDLDDEDIQEILDIIGRNVGYTSQIIHRIQEALRGERQVVNINAILYDVAYQAQQQWEAGSPGSQVVITTDLDNTIPQFEGPIGQITEVFTNLANNACRAMKSTGNLKVISKLDGDTVLVRVKDTGPGISHSILPRLFKRPVPTSGETGGTSGLGLYLGSLIIQSLGGSIVIEDTGPKGTVLLVRIPVPRSR